MKTLRRFVRWSAWLAALALGAGCGSSGSTTGTGGGSGAGGSGTGGTGGSGGSGGLDCQCGVGAYVPVCGTDGKTYDAACGTQCVPVAVACQGECPCSDAGAPSCGDAGFCLAGAVCVEEVFAPSCTNLSDPNAECPAGQTKTQCGGAGVPCCCEPPPASQYTCATPSGCSGAIDCSCISCPNGKQCSAVGSASSGVFRCEDPPMP